MARAGAVLLDIDGTLTDGVGGPALEGAVAAAQELARRFPVRYVTNTTSWTRAALEQALVREGFPLPEGALITPSVLARAVLTERGDDCGVLLADPGAREDLAWYRKTNPGEARSVLVATEGHGLTIRKLGPAVTALLGGARLYTLQQNRVFRRGGQLVTDLGPVAAFLGYAANTTWENLGKPSRLLFESIARELRLGLDALVMVGDDAEFDVAGALAAGCGAGVLVRTGKHRPGDENKFKPRPTLVLDSVADLPRALAVRDAANRI